MTHPLVDQLRFARSEFKRGLEGVTDEDARKRVGPMNCIAWNVGHLAWQEQRYWLFRAQGEMPFPDVNDQFAYQAAGTTPDLAEMWRIWSEITGRADAWLDALTTEGLQGELVVDGKPTGVTFGSLLLRNLYHYWYHTGENMGIRQALGHTGLPDFVGDIEEEAPYRPE